MSDTSPKSESASSSTEDASLNAKELKFKFETPKQEVEKPLKPSDRVPVSDELETQKLDIAEKDKDRREKRYFSAMKLIVGCLAFLGLIYIMEVAVILFGKTTSSDITNGILETVKTLLFTLSGYLFARKEAGD